MEEKVKLLQTEIYASLKDLKNKLENKVSVTDYQKYCMTLETKLGNMNETISQKSDKIEVKKALLFLESKIKEIILVIS